MRRTRVSRIADRVVPTRRDRPHVRHRRSGDGTRRGDAGRLELPRLYRFERGPREPLRPGGPCRRRRLHRRLSSRVQRRRDDSPLLQHRNGRRSIARRRRRIHGEDPGSCRGRAVRRPEQDLRIGMVQRRHVRGHARVCAERSGRRRRFRVRRPPVARLPWAPDADHRHPRIIRRHDSTLRGGCRTGCGRPWDRPRLWCERGAGSDAHGRQRDAGQVLGRVVGETERMPAHRPGRGIGIRGARRRTGTAVREATWCSRWSREVDTIGPPGPGSDTTAEALSFLASHPFPVDELS